MLGGDITAINRKILASVELSQLTELDLLVMELDYEQLFTLFISKRKITLLRFLFGLPP